jgi:hypothetical protein
MSKADSSYNLNNLTALAEQAGPKVTAAIKAASAKTGVDFAYLMQKASVESGLKTNAKSAGSSASGLYQFLDKTWMGMVKKYGDKFGMGNLADQIDAKGNCSDAITRHKILSLRNDPEKAACMAAEYDSDNKAYLDAHTSGTVGPTELYLAHFMGPASASGFLNAMQANPNQSAAQLFPKAAAANAGVFYDPQGQARSLSSVYDFFASKFQDTGSATTAVASISATTSASTASAVMAAATSTGADSDDSPTTDPNAVPKLADITWNEDSDTMQAAAVQVLSSTGYTAPAVPAAHSGSIWHGANAATPVMSPSMAMSINSMQVAVLSRLEKTQGYGQYNAYD